MYSRSFPRGVAQAVWLKAMSLSLETSGPTGGLTEWLAGLRIDRADFEDETSVIPLSVLHDALIAFVRLSAEEPVTLAPWLTHNLCLGAFAKPIRAHQSAEQALRSLATPDPDMPGQTVEWTTVRAAPGYFEASMRCGHDPALEKDGLLDGARKAELLAIVGLYGHRGASIVSTRAEDHWQYVVRWPVPSFGRLGPGLAVAVGALAGAPTYAFARSAEATLGAVAFGSAVGATVGAALVQWRRATVQQSFEATRLRALERSLAIRERKAKDGSSALLGTVLAGQYRVGDLMGTGASGAIYRAIRTTDGLPVALKLLRAAVAHDNVASDRLRREADALGLVWHPNVVEVIDHGELPDGTSYLVMELLRGETLASRLSRGTLTVQETIRIALELSDALGAVHAAGVLHRDLKPENVFLVPGMDECPHVKLFDFGIAKVEWEEMRITLGGGPMGTPGYMSPEQAAGRDADARSDLYSLGAVIFECVTGAPPFGYPRSGTVRTGGAPLDVGPVAGTIEGAPSALRPLLAALLSPDRDARPESARDVANMLRQLSAEAEAALERGEGSAAGV